MTKNEKEKIFVCNIQDLGEAEALGVDIDNSGRDSLFVVKFKSEVYAWKNSCPHINGAPMSWKKNAYFDFSKTLIQCAAHGALFEPSTGICVSGPCVGDCLDRVDFMVKHDGQIFIEK